MGIGGGVGGRLGDGAAPVSGRWLGRRGGCRDGLAGAHVDGHEGRAGRRVAAVGRRERHRAGARRGDAHVAAAAGGVGVGVVRAFTVITRSRLGRTASATAAWLASTSSPPRSPARSASRAPAADVQPTTTAPTTTVPETTCQRTITRARPCARSTPSQISMTARTIAARASSCSSGAAAAYSGPSTPSTERATRAAPPRPPRAARSSAPARSARTARAVGVEDALDGERRARLFRSG